MGNNQSTPLSLLVTNFKDVKARGRNLSVELKKGKLVTFCRSEWPSFGVGWPSEGTFCLSIITKVKTKIFLPGQSGHPDQIPYILVWQDLVENPPPWITPFILEPCKVLVTRPTRQKTPSAPSAPVLPDSQDPLTLEPTFPPPYPHLIPQDPVPQGGASVEGNREAEAAESESNLGGPAGRTRGRVQRDQASRLPDSTVALPLREIGSLDDTGLSRLMYWPFSTSDLYNWKSQNARFSDNPKDLTSLLDSVMFTHQPTWDDCQQLLRILFTTEERERIQVEARKLVPGDDGQPTANPDLINAAFPLTRPRWDYNTAEAARSPETCVRGTEDLLKTLGELGYRASATKAQICKSEVTYLGYLLKGGQRWLTKARKETVLRIPRPQSTRQVREFLGSAGFCRLWIPGFAELAKPLYQATKERQPFNWTEEAELAFQQIKTALLSAPALGLPDVSKPFHLYVDESKGVAKAMLTQYLGPWQRPVAYLSKKLDSVAAGWPPCLRIIAATALMVRDADKLIMGQELRVITPHAIEGVLRQPPDRWMSNARLTHYQGLLLNPLRITFLPPTSLNPASLLPNPDLDAPSHECTEILAQVHGVREDLQDRPLPDTELTWFTDGSSYVHQGQRYAGAAVTSETEVIWAEPLPPGTSAQRAELIALTQALTLGAEKKLTVYTDSRYAFATAHIHGAIYRERGLLTAEGKEIKNKQEILALLTALWKPKKLAIVHCPGHQKPTTPIARGNFLADQTARSIAKAPSQLLALQLPNPGPRNLPCFPDYTEQDREWMNTLPLKQVKNGWWTDINDQTILPEKLGRQVLEHIHRTTHLGARRMMDLIRCAKFRIRRIAELASDATTNCKACQLNNACPQTQTTTGIRCRGTRPGIYWEIDFTEIKPGKYGYQYLLVFVDTFSGWTEAFPTKRETAQGLISKERIELSEKGARQPCIL
ncbi:uncharacterized protein [Macaca fascicularis]|uniref:uncharacterized protein n=1 Tax=Macaca fascicularis TaxID=9541 RepID=UPI003D155E25